MAAQKSIRLAYTSNVTDTLQQSALMKTSITGTILTIKNSSSFRQTRSVIYTLGKQEDIGQA
jgi:hypothetical protein